MVDKTRFRRKKKEMPNLIAVTKDRKLWRATIANVLMGDNTLKKKKIPLILLSLSQHKFNRLENRCTRNTTCNLSCMLILERHFINTYST